jgi:hypothetical protein
MQRGKLLTKKLSLIYHNVLQDNGTASALRKNSRLGVAPYRDPCRIYSLGFFRFRLEGITRVFPAFRRGCITRSSASYALSAMIVSACISGNSSSAPSKSCSWPPVSVKLVGLPNPSTVAWIFVLRPPLLRPRAWFSSFFLLRQRYADEHAQSLHRSSHTHYQHRRPSA